MKAEDVADYLEKNPEFFETYSQMLSEIAIPHPYGGRTVSLSERQLVSLRERVKELEKKLHDLLVFATENDALQSKIQQFVLSLIGNLEADTAQHTITRNLTDIFAIPQVAIRLWQDTPPSAEVLKFADTLKLPVCVHHAVHDTQSWFGLAADSLHSFAYLPLKNGSETIGLLLLASEDKQRFYPEMGTVFLQRIAEQVSVALRPSN
jgi:uncharacterized protein YigA (DUF484 family)